MYEDLPESRTHLLALMRASSDAVFRMNPDWSVMRQLRSENFLVNTEYETLDWVDKYIYSEDQPLLWQKVKQALTNASVFKLEHRMRTINGDLAWVLSRAVPILGASGEILEWLGSVVDITEQKRLIEELDKQRRLYEAVTSGTPDLVYVFDLNYRFTYANPALLTMWGKTAEQAIGKNLLENGYEPWHAEMHEREIDEIVSTKQAVRGEVSFPHAVLGNRVYDYILTPVLNEQGVVTAVAGITRDVTERRSQEIHNMKLSEKMSAVNEELAATNEELNATNEELHLSQDLLRQAKSNLEQIMNMLPASVVVIRGYDLIVEMINNSNLDYWKKEKSEVIGRPFLEILPDLADQPFAGQLRHVMQTGEIIDVKESPVFFTMADGSVRETYVDYTYQPLADLSGKITGVLVMSSEITDRVQSKKLLQKYAMELAAANAQLQLANEELALSEQRFKLMIHEAPVAIGVLHGREMIVETANSKLLEVWGKNTDVIGKRLSVALPELSDQPFLTILDEVYTSGTAFYADEISAKLEHDGKLKELFFNVVYQPVSNASGATADILVVAVDVTSQVNARRQVEESEAHFRRLADLVPAKISNALPNGDVTFFNQAWLDFAGMSFEDLQNFGYREMMHPEEISGFQSGLIAAAQTGVPHVAEMRFKNISGEYVWHLNVASPILDETGSVTMWVGSTTDIQFLKEEEQRKSDFISMLSHELKTPVTSIKGHVQLLLRLLKKEQSSAFGDKMNSSLSRIDVLLVQLTGLIGGMLDLSRIDAGRMELKKEHFYIDALVGEVVEDFRLSHQQHYFHLNASSAVEVLADRDRISQVLINLIANAVKYSPNSDVVDITVSKVGTEVCIAIKDYGIGIDEKDQAKVFDRFFRVEGQTEKYYSGFGIGLFLAHTIVTRHEGTISLESVSGKGSTFTVHLPI